LKVKVIATFNTQKENLDPALLRKGRLAMEYQFDKLGIDDANRVMKHLKIESVATEPMTLTEIYNLSVDNGHKKEEKGPIGFAVR
jgi:ATP-dependent 26S proteasome regulatory subunit